MTDSKHIGQETLAKGNKKLIILCIAVNIAVKMIYMQLIIKSNTVHKAAK